MSATDTLRPRLQATERREAGVVRERPEPVNENEIRSRGGPAISIGIDGIKRRRTSLAVPCHPGTHVGEYVPFYFCPRSIMLYVISCANHPALACRGGQQPIAHVEPDSYEVIAWAERIGRRWAFSLSNAGARYTEFRDAADRLDELDWQAIASPTFSRPGDEGA